jgi:hypothetical protein
MDWRVFEQLDYFPEVTTAGESPIREIRICRSLVNYEHLLSRVRSAHKRSAWRCTDCRRHNRNCTRWKVQITRSQLVPEKTSAGKLDKHDNKTTPDSTGGR